MKIHELINSPITQSIKFISKKNLFRNSRTFYAVNTDGKKVAQFSLTATKEIRDLKLNKKYKRTQYGICILFAIKNFLENLCKKEKINMLHFSGSTGNPNNVVKLYKRFGTIIEDFEPVYFLWGVSKKGQKMAKEAVELLSRSKKSNHTLENQRYIQSYKKPLK